MSLKDIAGLGFSVTTAGTVLLFFLGRAYYSGLFGAWGASIDDVRVEFADLICPCTQSMVAIYHLVLTVLVSRRPVWPGSSGGEPLPPARGEVAYLWLRLAVLMVTTGIALTNGIGQTTCSLLLGTCLGLFVNWSLSHRSTESRIVTVALAFLALSYHAKYTGIHDAKSSSKMIFVQVKEPKENLTLIKIYVASTGAYGVTTLPGTEKAPAKLVLRFVPMGQIQSVTFVD